MPINNSPKDLLKAVLPLAASADEVAADLGAASAAPEGDVEVVDAVAVVDAVQGDPAALADAAMSLPKHAMDKGAPDKSAA